MLFYHFLLLCEFWFTYFHPEQGNLNFFHTQPLSTWKFFYAILWVKKQKTGVESKHLPIKYCKDIYFKQNISRWCAIIWDHDPGFLEICYMLFLLQSWTQHGFYSIAEICGKVFFSRMLIKKEFLNGAQEQYYSEEFPSLPFPWTL